MCLNPWITQQNSISLGNSCHGAVPRGSSSLPPILHHWETQQLVVLLPLYPLQPEPPKPLKMHSSWIKNKKSQIVNWLRFYTMSLKLRSMEDARQAHRGWGKSGAVAGEPLCPLCLRSRTSCSVFFTHLWLLYRQSRMPVCGRTSRSSDQSLASPFVVCQPSPLKLGR